MLLLIAVLIVECIGLTAISAPLFELSQFVVRQLSLEPSDLEQSVLAHPGFERVVHVTIVTALLVPALWILLQLRIGPWSRRTQAAVKDLLQHRQLDVEMFKRLAMVAENTTNAAVLTDCEARIVWVNAGFTRISGYTLDEVIGKVPGDFLQCEETDRETVANIRSAIREGRGYQGEILNRNKFGKTYWLELDIQPVFDSGGVHTGFIAIETEITIRKEAERAFYEAERFLKSAFDALPSKVVILDSHGVILNFNANWRQFIRQCDLRESDFVMGRNYMRCVAQLAGENSQAALDIVDGIKQLIAGNRRGFAIEFPLHSFSPQRWIELTITAFTGSGPMLLLLAHNDITVRKQAELMLSSNEEKLRCIYDASSDAILLLDETGVVSECNARAIQLVAARGLEELVGHQLWQLSPATQPGGESSEAKFTEQVQLALASGENRFEWEFSSKNGYDFPTEVLLSAFLYQGRQVLQCTVRDTSQRKEAEIWLHALNQQLQHDLESRTKAERTLRETTSYLDVYRKIVDQHAIVAETDTAGTIVAVNDAFCKISGYSREELIGQNHRILNAGVHDKSMWTEMYKCVANGGYWHGEICNRSKTGQLYWVDTTIAPLYNDTGKIRGYFAIRADITSLKVAQSQAEAASLTKSEFLANMSHEIRTPMTAILGYADLLAEYLKEVQAAKHTRDYIETIKRNGDHLLSIINDILDISKIEADKMTIEQIAVSPVTVVREVLELMRVKTQAKGLRLEAVATTSIPETIQTDPTRLRQILVNLVGNAIKFTEVGSIKITVRRHATIATQLCFEIQDSGIGMDSSQLAKLFQAFEQADTSTTRRFGGTGLGLRISKRLATMLGGEIEVTSELGSGSLFAFSIECGDLNNVGTLEAARFSRLLTGVDNTLSIPHSLASPGRQQLAGMRILLAEDGPDNQRLITFHLKKAGATVQLVDTGKHAVEALTVDGGLSGALIEPLPVDLILMDMQMPVMDGYDATRLLTSKGCPVPILALTAHAMASDHDKCLEAGCSVKLTKPIDRTVLLDACEYWGKRSAGSPFPIDTSSFTAEPTQLPC